jgi:hypothetical protein
VGTETGLNYLGCKPRERGKQLEYKQKSSSHDRTLDSREKEILLSPGLILIDILVPDKKIRARPKVPP